MNNRLLGTACILGSAVLLVDTGRHVVLGNEEVFDTIGLLTGIIWALGASAALVGLIQLNAVGRSAVVRALAFLPIIGFLLLILANIVQLAGLVTTEGNTVAGFGWLVQMAGMVVVGILTIAAGNWRGWRRFAPLATIVVVPLSLALGAAIDNMVLAATLVYIFWMVFGYAVATAGHVPAQQPGLAM